MVPPRQSKAKLIIILNLLTSSNIIRYASVLYSYASVGDLMDISQLEVFLAVAREGGFSRAADKLYPTQSAVSQAISKLETEIGESLFDRSARDGQLTDAGRVLQEYAELRINLRENAREALVELRE